MTTTFPNKPRGLAAVQAIAKVAGPSLFETLLEQGVATRFGLSVEEAAGMSGLGRTTIFEAIKDGRLEAKKSGRRTIVTPDAVRKFVASLPRR